jgi:hypothetical protein
VHNQASRFQNQIDQHGRLVCPVCEVAIGHDDGAALTSDWFVVHIECWEGWRTVRAAMRRGPT